MDPQGAGETYKKSRSFRYEDYNNRRAFLRSYPLYWGEEDEEHKEATELASNRRKQGRKIMLAVLNWKVKRILVFRRLKHKVRLYVITCLPVGFKAPTALISA